MKKFRHGDVVVPKPLFHHLDRDFFKGNSGKVIGVRKGYSNEKWFVTVLINNNYVEFFGSTLMLKETPPINSVSWNLFDSILLGAAVFLLNFTIGCFVYPTIRINLIAAVICSLATLLAIQLIKRLKYKQ